MYEAQSLGLQPFGFIKLCSTANGCSDIFMRSDSRRAADLYIERGKQLYVVVTHTRQSDKVLDKLHIIMLNNHLRKQLYMYIQYSIII